ncbi:gephyrin-like molybdotransferase Glp [Terriglobus sp. TAA 43]|uniref:molybdopterin molybdotransferase MoeA n=1 Tax=Terriglobus sp. TAA 43 TaxID=278961 RepID=UPI0006481E39|nr:gephyrin-like molybdotransferase Glp [Terriglobus sp. TAA 43]
MALITCQEALDLVAAYIAAFSPRTKVDRLPLEQALGRVLAQPIHADRDQPPFPRSTRDGYAVRAVDHGVRRLVGSVRAGEVWTGAPLAQGEAIEVMTGAPVPEGADAVVMLEHVEVVPQGVSIADNHLPSAGDNVVPRGQEARTSDVLLRAGVRLTAAEIALAASVGAAELNVYVQPVAAILATGDELVSVDQTPAPHQIRNSNSHTLAALTRQNGGVPRVLSPALDSRESLLERLTAARHGDLLLLSGGVSAGKYDLVEDVLLALGAEFYFTGVFMQPGKPVVFGRLPATDIHAEQWIFGLPGNPVSTLVTALLFAMPMLRALGGESSPKPRFVQAALASAMKVRPGLTRFVPARLYSSLDVVSAEPVESHGSGDLVGNARADGYIVVPSDADSLTSGATVTVLLR